MYTYMYTHRRNECMFFESYIWDTLFAEQKYIGKVFLVNIYKTYFNLSYKILSYSTYRWKSNEKLARS